jgi:oxaloacetate decarboxylase (Na+ extruding) subunit gamma
MNGEFVLATQIFVIGLITVFFVLLVVVQVGNLIIWFVNRFIGEASIPSPRGNTSIPSSKIAAITQAVLLVTGGKGKIVSIEKQ